MSGSQVTNKDVAMIKVPQPAMVLNAPDSPARYRMHVTYDVPKNEPIDVFLRQVRQAALRQGDKRLRCLVINCHGIYHGQSPSWTGGYGLSLGTGIRYLNVHYFNLLREGDATSRGLVDHIWITSCGAAAVSPTDSQGDGNGMALCRKIAKYSGANVTAANIIQVAEYGQMTPHHISDFEGLTRQFAPDGAIVWQHDYPHAFLQTLRFGPN
jgi:hypothetical protein